jgi:rhodanese-related sulfurtransferase
MYENGFENVSVLLGGFEAWIAAGYPEQKYEG